MNWHRPALLAVIVGAALCATRASARSGVAEIKLAEQHLSAVRTVQRWAAFAYGLRAPVANPCQPMIGDVVFNPDGSTSQHFVNEDCSQADVTVQPDTSFTTDIKYPGGLEEHVQGVASDFVIPDPPLFPQQFDITHTLSTGDRAHYVQKFQLEDNGTGLLFIVNTTTDGTLTLGSGETAKLHFVQPRPSNATAFTDVLDLTLPSHEKLHWEVPITRFFDDFGNLGEEVDFTRPAPGSYQAGASSIDFQVLGANDRFNRWLLGDGGKLSGQFVLNQDFSGSGRALRGKQLVFVGKWDVRARGTILLADGQAAVAGPSRGATDFGNLRFRALGLANAPAPGL